MYDETQATNIVVALDGQFYSFEAYYSQKIPKTDFRNPLSFNDIKT